MTRCGTIEKNSKLETVEKFQWSELLCKKAYVESSMSREIRIYLC